MALADLVIVNKMDIARAGGQLAELVAGLNPMARVEASTYSQVDLSVVLALGEYRKTGRQQRTPESILSSLDLSVHHGRSGLRSCTVEVPALVGLASFERWLFTLLWERQAAPGVPLEEATDLMRVKGLICAKSPLGEPRMHVLQAVQDMYEITPVDMPVGRPRSCLVLIGTISGRDEDAIRQAFVALLSGEK